MTPSRALLPDDHVFRRDVFGLAIRGLALNVRGVQRSGYLYDEAGSGELRVKVGLDRDGIGDTGGSDLIHGG